MAKKEETTEDLGFSVDGDEVNDLPLQEVEQQVQLYFPFLAKKDLL